MRRNRSLRLDVKTPSLFRCPISLEVMRSPVSLCTGVTYDRSSIQRWIDSGNTTCPATMLPLPSTDLVPNLTLRRLIHLWSTSSLLSQQPLNPPDSEDGSTSNRTSVDLSEDPLPLMQKLKELFTNDDVDESVKNGVVADGVASIVLSVLNADINEAAITVLSLILNADFISKCNKERTISSILAESDRTVATILAMLQSRRVSPKSRTAAVRVLDAALSAESSDVKILIGRKEGLVDEIVRLIDDGERSDDVDAGLSCLLSLWSSPETKAAIVRAGTVAALVRVLLLDPPPAATVTEKAMMMLEAAACCTEGQAAVAERTEECVDAAVRKMMKAGTRGRDAAVGFLWTVCYGAGGRKESRRRAREAVAAASGAMAKILVVMQGDCAPRVTRMAGELLRLFRGRGKGRLAAGYDTRTTHIMPF